MTRLEFDVARRQQALIHHNGERTRRFSLNPHKAAWYGLYRCARLAMHGHATRDGAAALVAMRAYLIQKQAGDFL